jgi:hypothetical protein
MQTTPPAEVSRMPHGTLVTFHIFAGRSDDLRSSKLLTSRAPSSSKGRAHDAFSLREVIAYRDLLTCVDEGTFIACISPIQGKEMFSSTF